MIDILWIIILFVSLALLIKGADWFTMGAESVGLRLGMTPFVIGVLIVGVGTSLPELASSIAAVLSNNTEIVVANIVGSNIANSLLVLGLAAFVGGGIVTNRAVSKYDMPFLFVATVLLSFAAFNGMLSRIEAIIFLVLLTGYIYWLFSQKKEEVIDTIQPLSMSAFMLIGGGIVLIVSAKLLIDSVIVLATSFGISPAIISASIVAFGTSVPEVVVSIVAILKKKNDLALGNILGSNLFNILLVGGVAGIISPLVINQKILTFAIPVLFVATITLWFFLQQQKVSRLQGAGLFVAYILFLGFLFF